MQKPLTKLSGASRAPHNSPLPLLQLLQEARSRKTITVLYRNAYAVLGLDEEGTSISSRLRIKGSTPSLEQDPPEVRECAQVGPHQN